MQTIRNHKFITVCVILAIIVVCVVFYSVFTVTAEDIADRENAIKETVQERALQCYRPDCQQGRLSDRL